MPERCLAKLMGSCRGCKVQDEASLAKLSTLPSRDNLLGQLLEVLIAPQYRLVGTLNTNMQKLVYILQAKAGGEK